MVNFYPNERIAGGVNTVVLSRDAENQALIAEWQQWASEATPTENRAEAVDVLIHCLQSNSKVLSLAYLGLTSLPTRLPPFIRILQVCGNQLEQLPPLTALSLRMIYAANNRLSTLPAPLPTSLEILNVEHNALKSLPALPSSLEQLNVDCNKLEGLPELPINLQRLYISHNRLEQLPELPINLQRLYVSHNRLERLPSLPTNLQRLYVNNNRLEQLPSLPTGLQHVDINNNRLKQLPALPLILRYLNAADNWLERLPALPVGLRHLDVTNNRLGRLPELPVGLQRLDATNNWLERLPELPVGLQRLDVTNNLLEQLPQLPVGLQRLDTSNNLLEQLPELPVGLQYLDATNNRLEGLSELPVGLQYLNVSHNAINALPEGLPAGLMCLYVNDNQLRRLPVLPASLRRMDIRNNPFEQPLPPFPDFLIIAQESTIESVISYFTVNVQVWEPIGREAYVDDFKIFLEKLQGGPNNQDSAVLRQRVGDWLDYLAKEENKVLRANTFLIAQEATTRCVDRASFYFNKMYLLMREDQLIKTDTPVVELFNTNLGLFRLQQLEKIASQKAETRRGVSSGFAEELEIYLAYECLLREELSLPIYSELQFSEIAGLTQDDLTRAKNEIEQQEKAGFIGYLINESASWQARLTQWDRLQVESVEEAYLDFIGSDDFNQQVNEQLVKDKIDIHDADAQRNMSKTLAEGLLYQQRYQLTREFLVAQGELTLLDGFHRQYASFDAS